MILRKPLLFSFAIASFIAFSSFNTAKPAAKFLGDDDDSRRVSINNEYSLNIPNALVEDKTLNDDASLQYADVNDEVYVIVIDEGKDDFIKTFKDLKDYNPALSVEKNYRRVQMNFMTKKMKSNSKPVIKSLEIDGRESEIVDFVAKVKGIKAKIFYKCGFTVTDDKCYMIMAWTLADYQTKNNTELEDMIKSFRLEK